MSLPKSSSTETLYQMLILLHALDPIREERSEFGSSGGHTKLNHSIVRRSFVDGLAYIPAYRSGRDHVTATAIQRTPAGGTTIWLASNKRVAKRVSGFLTSILRDLEEIAQLGQIKAISKMNSKAERLLPRIVEFVAPKLHRYHRKALENVPLCLKVIKDTLNQKSLEDVYTDRLLALQEWLEQKLDYKNAAAVSPQEEELEVLVRNCHDLRESKHVETFALLGSQAQKGHQEFLSLYKHLGKLAKPIAIVDALVRAALMFPGYFEQGFELKILPSQAARRFQNTSFEGTMDSIFTPEEKTRYLDRLRFLRGENTMSDILNKDHTFSALVHAELRLLDHFWRNSYQFWERDRYIGCSKPACYSCYRYISNHPGNFVDPPSHHKIYLGWRAPNADPDLPLSMLADLVRRDLFDEIESPEPRRDDRPDSPA